MLLSQKSNSSLNNSFHNFSQAQHQSKGHAQSYYYSSSQPGSAQPSTSQATLGSNGYIKPFFEDNVISPTHGMHGGHGLGGKLKTSPSYRQDSMDYVSNSSYSYAPSPTTSIVKSPSRSSLNFSSGMKIDCKSLSVVGLHSYMDEHDYLGGSGRPRSPPKDSPFSVRLTKDDLPPSDSLHDLDYSQALPGVASGGEMPQPNIGLPDTKYDPMDLGSPSYFGIQSQSTSKQSPFQPSNLYHKFISSTPSAASPSNPTDSVQRNSHSSPPFIPDPALSITVFGFSPQIQKEILQLFSSIGPIVYSDIARQPNGVNWLVIMYHNQESVTKAMSLNGIFESGCLIGVAKYLPNAHRSPTSTSTTSDAAFSSSSLQQQPQNDTKSSTYKPPEEAQKQIQNKTDSTPVTSTTTKVTTESMFKNSGHPSSQPSSLGEFKPHLSNSASAVPAVVQPYAGICSNGSGVQNGRGAKLGYISPNERFYSEYSYLSGIYGNIWNNETQNAVRNKGNLEEKTNVGGFTGWIRDLFLGW